MRTSTGKLSAVSDVQSVARLDVGAASKTLEAPAATLGGCSSGSDARTRDLPTPRPLPGSKGADVAQSTRGFPRSDSETRTSAVKITPASSDSATVPSTSTTR